MMLVLMHNKVWKGEFIGSVHEGKKPFQCNLCDATIRLKQTLKSQTGSIHE